MYVMFGRVMALVLLSFRSSDFKGLEIVVLRHEHIRGCARREGRETAAGERCQHLLARRHGLKLPTLDPELDPAPFRRSARRAHRFDTRNFLWLPLG